MDGQRLPALHNLLGWCPGPHAQVPWREMHSNLCLPSSLVQPWGPPHPLLCLLFPRRSSDVKSHDEITKRSEFPLGSPSFWFHHHRCGTTKCEETSKIWKELAGRSYCMYVTVNFKHELTETPADTRHANTHTHTNTCTHSYKRLLQMLSMRNVLRVTFCLYTTGVL